SNSPTSNGPAKRSYQGPSAPVSDTRQFGIDRSSIKRADFLCGDSNPACSHRLDGTTPLFWRLLAAPSMADFIPREQPPVERLVLAVVLAEGHRGDRLGSLVAQIKRMADVKILRRPAVRTRLGQLLKQHKRIRIHQM